MPQFFIFFFYLSFNRDRISFGFQKTEPHWSWSEGFWISKFVVLIWSMVSNDRFWLSSRKKKTKGKLLLIKNEKKPSDLANAIWSSKTLINPKVRNFRARGKSSNLFSFKKKKPEKKNNRALNFPNFILFFSAGETGFQNGAENSRKSLTCGQPPKGVEKNKKKKNPSNVFRKRTKSRINKFCIKYLIFFYF